jgi:cytochrome c biogenesis protein CcmG/thiol:disulfide interchange protein DsbE
VRNKKLFALLAVGAAVLLVGLFIAAMVTAAQPGNRPSVGSTAPDFNISLYKDYQANLPATVKLSELRGKVVVVNFWASWCVECKKESDALEAAWRSYGNRGLVVLGVDYLDNQTPAYQYLQAYNTTYPVGIDLQEQISHLYRITGVPETFFIDKKGVVRKTVLQALSPQELNSTVESLLNE